MSTCHHEGTPRDTLHANLEDSLGKLQIYSNPCNSIVQAEVTVALISSVVKADIKARCVLWILTTP